MVRVVHREELVPRVPSFKSITTLLPHVATQLLTPVSSFREYCVNVRCTEIPQSTDLTLITNTINDFKLLLKEGVPFLIGRQSTENIFCSPLLSRRHAELLALEDKVSFELTKSSRFTLEILVLLMVLF